ncbi:MAG TPA: serine/threonine-protein kinase [Gemmatimonadaceae bacterium]|nr:serine/threonine-protein kinase [Gemmatimonadaceae bacterium]
MPSPTPTLPQALQDRYRVERELGRGGMGAVYLATDVKLDRQVALKVLPPEFAGDEALRDRFLRETRTAASFSHPNVVPVYAVEEDRHALAFVMGFVEGESLTARVARTGPLDARTTVRLLQDVAYALAYAHGRGVVHRDIKPDNIMIERATGRALVMDFGIARAITPRNDAPGLTRVGEVVGTPEYMSPEQASGDHVDGRSDLYSLGLVALFAITGRPPITGESTQQIIVRQLTEQLPAASSLRPDLPPALCDAIDRCVAKEPTGRFESAEALVDAIDAAQLAAPEIPVAIRLLAQEAGQFAFVGIFAFLLAIMAASQSSGRGGDIVSLLPVMALAGALVMRVGVLRADIRRLGAAGFTAADVVAGMQAVLDEREQVRALDVAAAAARRRRGVITAVLLLPAAFAIFRVAMGMRQPNADGTYRIGVLGAGLLFVAVAMAGAAIFQVVRAFRTRPVNDRLLALFWLSSVGHRFIASAIAAGHGVAVDSAAARTLRSGASPRPQAARPAPAPPAPPAPAAAAAPPAASTDARLARIEDRLAAIERAVTPPGIP